MLACFLAAVDWWNGTEIDGARLVNGSAPNNGVFEVRVGELECSGSCELRSPAS